MPGINSYSSTKILVSRFCEAIAEEVRNLGVDVMSWEAGPIKTKLNPGSGISCKSAVLACFSKIGFESRTDGHILFELMMASKSFFSLSLFGNMIARKTSKLYKEKI